MGETGMMPDRKIRLVEQPADGSLESMSDDDLFLLAQADRKDAFEQLIRRHQRLVLGLAIRYLGDPAAGRDVSQDVFLALWSERHRYQPKGRFVSYLISMTTNRCNYVARQRTSNFRKIANLSREPDRDSKDMPASESQESNALESSSTTPAARKNSFSTKTIRNANQYVSANPGRPSESPAKRNRRT